MPYKSHDFSPVAVSVTDAARMLGVSRKTIYAMGKRGEFRLLKLGESERTVIPYGDLLALVERSQPRELAQ